MKPVDFYNASKRKIYEDETDFNPKITLRSGTSYSSEYTFRRKERKKNEANTEDSINTEELLIISSDEENPLHNLQKFRFDSEKLSDSNYYYEKNEEIYEIESVNSSLTEGKCIMKLKTNMIIVGYQTNSNDSDLSIYSHSLSFRFYTEGKFKKYKAIELTVNFEDILNAYFVYINEVCFALLHINQNAVDKYKRFFGSDFIFKDDYPFDGILFRLYGQDIFESITPLFNYIKSSGCNVFRHFGFNQRVYILRSLMDYQWPKLLIDICRSIFSDNSEVILAYPVDDTLSKSISISISDFVTLLPGRFLNDTIVEFYLYYIFYQKIPPNIRDEVHIFSTYFYQKIKSIDSYTKDLLKWTNNIQLIKKKYIILPVNKELHWSLFIVCFIGQLKHEQHYITIEDHEKPCIIALDSLKIFKDTDPIFNDIRQYLNWVLKETSPEFNIEITRENMPSICPKVLRQQNTSDCGIFLLQYTESFLSKDHKEIPKEDYTDLFSMDIINEKRKSISVLIASLASRNIKNQNSQNCSIII